MSYFVRESAKRLCWGRETKGGVCREGSGGGVTSCMKSRVGAEGSVSARPVAGVLQCIGV